ncbi:ATP-dependent Clp protease proteolytic subunit [Agrobacterium pusense]|jgi:hypothetical protein|uniref:ATP-dependent Clp protease proteolytic subunit n=1 Tax=Agrobacterium pusense TaxID=648995 RepID=UPI002452A084|nr:ATP-dependent Clp protease proteolytic subunit [Agrobacterium pusense]
MWNLKILRMLSLTFLFCCFAHVASAAEIALLECEEFKCLPYDGFLRIEGELKETDATLAASVYASRKKATGQYVVFISSPGGSVEGGIALGDWVRQEKLGVSVADNDVCYSACVYVLAGGVMRWANGKIGIHRPFFEKAEASDVAAGLRSLEDMSAAFFRRVNLPEGLSQHMFSVLPENLHILTKDELQKYRLNQQDIVDAEIQANNEAARLGLSRLEYNKRLGLMRSSGILEYCQSLKGDKQMACNLTAMQQFGLLLPTQGRGTE